MARSYSVPTTCSTLAASAVNPYLIIVATAASQPSIFEINSGSYATPANNAASFNVTKGTAIGTLAGAITPSQINAVSGTAIASIFTAGNSSSALPTLSGIQLAWAQNQNTAYRWVASSPQRMIMLPSTASAGAGLVATNVNAAWASYHVGFHVEE